MVQSENNLFTNFYIRECYYLRSLGLWSKDMLYIDFESNSNTMENYKKIVFEICLEKDSLVTLSEKFTEPLKIVYFLLQLWLSSIFLIMKFIVVTNFFIISIIIYFFPFCFLRNLCLKKHFVSLKAVF